VIKVSIRMSSQPSAMVLARLLAGVLVVRFGQFIAFRGLDIRTESAPDRIRAAVRGHRFRRGGYCHCGPRPIGPGYTADNIGVSFDATDLADPRLDPESSNLDEQLRPLGSPELRFGGNALDRRTFWTSTGETPKYDEKVTVTPDLYDGAWMEAVAESDVKKTAISQHWYQFYGCDSRKAPRPRSSGGEPHRSVGEEVSEEELGHRDGRDGQGRGRRPAFVARGNWTDELSGNE